MAKQYIDMLICLHEMTPVCLKSSVLVLEYYLLNWGIDRKGKLYTMLLWFSFLITSFHDKESNKSDVMLGYLMLH